ncbi:hypothetical protein MXD63_35180, partial [Frankia sp. Cpl3]|nr:hypothetical protein [Frankia sp. Cpl3]
LLPYFSSLTSMETGILHVWEEGDLKQLPLALCRVQAVDPLSEGPAMLLPEVVCSGLTHEEVRGEAGLTGIEAYVSRLVGPLLTPPCSEQNEAASLIAPEDFVGVGAGGTAAEAICRGLQKCLTEELGRQMVEKQAVSRVQLDAVEDERCRFYLQALTTMKGAPAIGWGADISGFPVVWVGTEDCWYGSVGLNLTLALRNALQQALLHAQNPAAYLTQQALSTQMAHLTQTAHLTTQALEASSVHLGEQMKAALAIPSCEPVDQSELLQSALQILKQNQMRLMVLDLALEPFLQEELAGVFGVLLRKEESA